MWWGVPIGFVESRSLLDQGEFPLPLILRSFLLHC
jgi:hypothetical protein